MRKILLILCILTSVIACKSDDPDSTTQAPESQETPVPQLEQNQDSPVDYVQITAPPGSDLEALLDQAEADATPEGRHILETARVMISNQEIILGSCWDYMDAVYDRAQRQRKTVFSSRFAGPYLKENLIQAGDWLYFVNHTYNDGEHSGIFVTWLDYAKKEALMINYVGENRIRPGTYKKYVIDQVYNIMRANYY